MTDERRTQKDSFRLVLKSLACFHTQLIAITFKPFFVLKVKNLAINDEKFCQQKQLQILAERKVEIRHSQMINPSAGSSEKYNDK